MQKLQKLKNDILDFRNHYSIQTNPWNISFYQISLNHISTRFQYSKDELDTIIFRENKINIKVSQYKLISQENYHNEWEQLYENGITLRNIIEQLYYANNDDNVDRVRFYELKDISYEVNDSTVFVTFTFL